MDIEGYFKYLAKQKKLLGDEAIKFWSDYFETEDEDVLYPILAKFTKLITMYTKDFANSRLAGKNYYKLLFGKDDTNIGEFLRTHPFLATISNDLFISKLEGLINLFDLSQDEALKIIEKNPIITGLNFEKMSDKNSVNSKFLKLRKIVTKSELLKNPNILNVPAQKLMIRYMIAVNANVRNEFIVGGYMCNERAIYAKSMYLTEKNLLPHSAGNRGKSLLYATKARFEKKTGVSVDDLIEKYPLNIDALKHIEEDFKKVSKEIALTENEKDSILGG